MNSPTSSTDPPYPHNRLGLGLLLLLAALELPLAFRSGAFLAHSWLPVAIAVAAAALVIILSGPAPRLSRPQTALLGVFAFLAIWTVCSILWAGSRTNAWEEADRTLLYLLGAGLAAVAVRWAGPRGMRWLAFGVLAVVGVVGAGVMVRLAWGDDLLSVFAAGRLRYPVTYWNGQAALLMMGFWLALSLGTTRTQIWWRRGLLLALAVMLVELAVLPQSRGALWTLVIVLPWFVVLTPHRFRGLVDLGVVMGLAALAWPALNAVWAQANGRLTQVATAAQAEAAFAGAVHHALLAVLLCGAAAFALSALVSAAEARISPLDRRWVRRIGLVLMVIALVAVGLGLFTLQRAEGDLTDFAHRTWAQVTSDRGPAGGSTSRFSELGFSGRITQWRNAAKAVSERPLLGFGAQNFEFYFMEHRTTGLTVNHAHSQPMQVLADLGLPGAAAYAIFIVGTLLFGIRTRFRARRPENQAAMAAGLLAVGSWVVHSTADWMWQLGGVTWPAMLLLGGLLAAGVGPGQTDPGGPRPRPMTATAIRIAVAAAAMALLLSGSAFYLSARYAQVALKNAGAPIKALAAAEKAEWLNPFSPSPAQARADTYLTAARRAAGSQAPDRDWAALDNLALRVHALQEAEEREPVAWIHPYQTGLAVLEYRDTAVAAGALPTEGGAAALPPPPGQALGSLASSPAQREVVAGLRTLSAEGLGELAGRHLHEAKRLNPLQAGIDQALARILPAGD